MYEGNWMSGSGGRRITPGVAVLLGFTIGAFLLQLLWDLISGGGFTSLFGLSLTGLKRGFIWQLVTYLFVHGSFGHLFLNMLALFFIGPETERAVGTRQFVVLYLLSGVLGGLGWVLISNVEWARCVGASGAVFGILGAFAALFPNRPITLLVFYVLPVTMRAWVLAVLLGLMELAFLLSSSQNGIAYSAHLAGGVAGYLYARVAFGRYGVARDPGGYLGRLGSLLSERRARNQASEVDRILEKVAREGIGSLTASERRTMERASRERR